MADVIFLTPGQTVGDGDLTAIQQQHGGVHTPPTVRPPTQAEMAAASTSGDTDATFDQRPIYRTYFNDGTYIDTRGDPGGADTKVIAYQPSQKFQQQQAAATRANTPRTPAEQAADAKALQDQKESEANAALPGGPREQGGQDPQYETNAARAARAERTIAQQRADANTAADNKRADDAAAQAAALRNRPTVTIKDDGKGGLVSISVDPTTGTPTTVPIPGVQGKPDQVTVAGVVYERGVDGNYAPAKGIPNPNTSLPADLPPFSPDINKPAFGIVEYAQAVNALAATKNADGTPKLTEAQKNAILASAHADALAEAQRIDTLRASQQASQTNEINQRNADEQASVARGNQAVQATQDAMTTGTKLMSMMSPSSLKGADPIVPGLLGTAYQQAGQWGGLDKPAPVDTSKYPALQALNQLGITPSPPTGADVAAQTQSTMAQSGNAFTHALGPGGAPPAAPPAAPQGPLPPIGPANLFPTPQGGMPSQNQAAPPQLGQGQDASSPGGPMTPPPVNPMPGQPGNDSNAPVGMAQPSWGPMQHPAVAQTMNQPPDPSIDPQAWQNAVAQASRMLGLG